MNKDIKTTIYGNLSLKEKLKIADINDITLYKEIIAEIRETWYYWIMVDEIDRTEVPDLGIKIRGKDEEEVLWKVFMENENFLREILIQFNRGYLEKFFKLSYCEYNWRKVEMGEIRDKILKRNSKEEIIKTLRKGTLNQLIYIWKMV